MDHLDPDEIVFVDTDGLGFTRADYPAFDFPVGTRVVLATIENVTGTVVDSKEAVENSGPDGPLERVPVRWDGSATGPNWQPVDGLVRL